LVKPFLAEDLSGISGVLELHQMVSYGSLNRQVEPVHAQATTRPQADRRIGLAKGALHVSWIDASYFGLKFFGLIGGVG
jgi:hypothetical protein